MSEFIQEAKEIIAKKLQDDGRFPNNKKLPLLLYKQAIQLKEGDAAKVEQVFEKNLWGNSWRNGIYNYHHYHSTTHEVLGVYQGEAEVQLGGPEGISVKVQCGDVIIIPAGVAHKNLRASSDFACVGAYPPGQSFDMNYGKEEERTQADENIAQVPLPETDPVYGKNGTLIKQWL
ncbi:cupin domain-containing protein [Catalinimonas niigatensis]|uniref:cupin domain-containing protein n=1 Tax=Catalinimonas niigatensis TaxID=1397264 RepID=UPI002665DD5A|nr:cupin domain-containing protein [Catalinimonas niigatensis]WPP51304.1 cupin domain-containing protein [Catalinimonas niigatensis]